MHEALDALVTEQSKANRSCHESLVWYCKLLKEGLMEPLCETMGLMADPEVLDALGLELSSLAADTLGM